MKKMFLLALAVMVIMAGCNLNDPIDPNDPNDTVNMTKVVFKFTNVFDPPLYGDQWLTKNKVKVAFPGFHEYVYMESGTVRTFYGDSAVALIGKTVAFYPDVSIQYKPYPVYYYGWYTEGNQLDFHYRYSVELNNIYNLDIKVSPREW